MIDKDMQIIPFLHIDGSEHAEIHTKPSILHSIFRFLSQGKYTSLLLQKV